MRRLLLLRHAKAERSEPGAEDLARTLIDRGRKDAAKIGAYMASHALVPSRVVMSPSARTEETWKYAAAAFQPAPAALSEDGLYDASAHDVINIIRSVQASAPTLLIIGHNPGLHEAAVLLIASGDVDTRERLRENLPTSGLVVIDFAFDDWDRLHVRSGRLERFVSPKSLEAATR